MSVTLTTVLLSAALSQATGRPSGPTPVRASLEQPAAFVNLGAPSGADQFERGIGTATFDVVDQVAGDAAPWGDTGTVSAEVRTAGGTWGIELTQVGFPQGAEGLAPGFPVQGGVVRDVALHGGAPRGYAAFPRTRAAAAVWGLGTVRLNGRVVAERVPVYAAALVEGFHADDDTHRVLPGGRALDAELHVVALAVPLQVDPRGFVELSFDEVRIEAAGTPVRAVARVDSTVAPAQPGGAAIAATTAVPLAATAAQTGVGGSGTPGSDTGSAATGASSTAAAQQATGLVRTPDPLTTRTGTALIATPPPANATPGVPLPTTPAALSAAPATALPTTTTPTALPGNTPATALPTTPAPTSPFTTTPGTATPPGTTAPTGPVTPVTP